MLWFTSTRARCALGAAGALMLAGSAPGAFSLGFGGVANNDADNVAAGAAQLSWSAEEFDTGSVTGPTQVAFTIRNEGDLALTVTRIYFDADIFSAIVAIDSPDAGVAFATDVGPPVLPGGNAINFTTRSGLRAGAVPPGPANGVNPGESVTVIVELGAGFSFLDTLIGLNDGSVRLGLHVQSFEGGGSESFVNEELPESLIPTPGAIVLFGLAGLLGFPRRRRLRLA